MAFRRGESFHTFLQQVAQSEVIRESAPAVNFLLDERLPGEREDAFLTRLEALREAVEAGEWDADTWRMAFRNHFREKVKPQDCEKCVTFRQVNQRNILLEIAPEQDVVRLESIPALYKMAEELTDQASPFESACELAEALSQLIESRNSDGKVESDLASNLQLWVNLLNISRDTRPTFTTPYDGHEQKLKLERDDWATYLRNVLGLKHIHGTPDEPCPVVLMRYNLTRVYDAARDHDADGWAAAPTVLEAGNANGPNETFFPYPLGAADTPAYGATVSLSDEDDGFDCQPEFLHWHIDYELDDFHKVGEITDMIDDEQLRAYRERHLNLHAEDFRFLGDLP